jgi:hypothetical protein
MPKPVWYRTKLTQSGIFLVQYRSKIRDAGMPMPVLVPRYQCPDMLINGGHELTSLALKFK